MRLITVESLHAALPLYTYILYNTAESFIGLVDSEADVNGHVFTLVYYCLCVDILKFYYIRSPFCIYELCSISKRGYVA